MKGNVFSLQLFRDQFKVEEERRVSVIKKSINTAVYSDELQLMEDSIDSVWHCLWGWLGNVISQREKPRFHKHTFYTVKQWFFFF